MQQLCSRSRKVPKLSMGRVTMVTQLHVWRYLSHPGWVMATQLPFLVFGGIKDARKQSVW